MGVSCTDAVILTLAHSIVISERYCLAPDFYFFQVFPMHFLAHCLNQVVVLNINLYHGRLAIGNILKMQRTNISIKDTATRKRKKNLLK